MSLNNNDQNKKTIKEGAARRKRRRITIFIIIIVVIALIIAAGGYFFKTYRHYSGFSVRSNVELRGASDNLSYHKYGKGFLQCSSNGVTYFTRDEIIWDETFEMNHPLIDVCGDYAAVADMKQSDIYIYDKNGLVNRISSPRAILDVEVAGDGTVCVSTSQGESSFIELKDKEGNELINIKKVFSSSGYLGDITLSEDGNRLAAAFIYVSQGSLESNILFYDFSRTSTDEMLVGGFSQYSDTIITTVEFMNNNVVCAIGDNALTFYRFSSVPEIIHEELDIDWEIQSMSMNSSNVLFITKDSSGENNYRAFVYNTSGKLVSDVGFDFAYSKAILAGNNIVLYSQTDCQIYSFKGFRRFSGSFGERISCMLSAGSDPNLLLATTGQVRLIQLK